ncbi:MAG: ROK family protein [Methylococcales bacterium]
MKSLSCYKKQVIVDPDEIVLGGGLSNCEYLYSAVPQRWSRYIFSDEVNTRWLAAAIEST